MVIALNIFNILQIILVFGALMFIHELGHFLFAKKAGIFVREFSLGIGPKLFSFKKGETKYSLRILPFAAFVRMAGEDPEIIEIKTGQTIGVERDRKGVITDIYTDKDVKRQLERLKIEEIDLEHKLFISGVDIEEQQVSYPVARNAVIHEEKNEFQIAPWDRQFGSKSIKDRFAAIFAGPLFNILFTIILFFIVALMVGIPTTEIEIAGVNTGSPAETAGLHKGDVIVAIDNQAIESDNQLINMISNASGKELSMLVDRSGETVNVKVTPKSDESGEGKIGVALTRKMEDATVIEASKASITNTVKMTVMIIDGFGKLFSGHLSMNDVAGPVGILKVTSDAAKQGVPTLINWAAILSLYLGIFNLLPIPALDGSRLVFISIEAFRGKPIDPRKESMVHFIGFAFLMLLMLVVSVNDFSKIFH